MQKGVGDKAVNQLEKSISSKLEGSVTRQIQAQFQTSGKQALQVIVSYTYISCSHYSYHVNLSSCPDPSYIPHS
jgi:hypothetical protein